MPHCVFASHWQEIATRCLLKIAPVQRSHDGSMWNEEPLILEWPPGAHRANMFAKSLPHFGEYLPISAILKTKRSRFHPISTCMRTLQWRFILFDAMFGSLQTLMSSRFFLSVRMLFIFLSFRGSGFEALITNVSESPQWENSALLQPAMSEATQFSSRDSLYLVSWAWKWIMACLSLCSSTEKGNCCQLYHCLWHFLCEYKPIFIADVVEVDCAQILSI